MSTAFPYNPTLRAGAPAGAVARAVTAPGSNLAFKIFILVNAALFVRPSDLLGSDLPIYKMLIVLCLAMTFTPIYRALSLKNLKSWPISFCVVGLLLAVLCSHLIRFDIKSAQQYGIEFFQFVLYFMLLVVLVSTPARMHKFLIALNIFTLILSAIALADYLGYIHLNTIVMAEETLSTDGKYIGPGLKRLAATGIFANPNDLSRILVIGITISLYALMEKGGSSMRFLWAVPALIFAYALMLTYSRGGMLALFAGLGVLFASRYGWRRTIVASVILVPALLMTFGGRQTDFNAKEGTGQERIRLWAEGFERLQHSPVFGIGTNKLSEEIGLVAHNSYVQAYVEMGFFGGTLFVGAFFLAMWCVYRLGKIRPEAIDPELWRLRPYVLSIVAGTVVGMLTSTRTYNLPTYMVLGLAASYVRLTADQVPGARLKINRKLLGQLCMVSLAVFFTTYIYIRLSVHWE
ncbi:MAG TPA: O-antigen ligase family protein [Tepidisphaeraceae bacterium]